MASVDGVESFPPPNNMASVRRGIVDDSGVVQQIDAPVRDPWALVTYTKAQHIGWALYLADTYKNEQ
jgi:hypothetical protein